MAPKKVNPPSPATPRHPPANDDTMRPYTAPRPRGSWDNGTPEGRKPEGPKMGLQLKCPGTLHLMCPGTLQLKSPFRGVLKKRTEKKDECLCALT